MCTKHLRILFVVMTILSSGLTAPPNAARSKLVDPMYMKAITAYRNLEPTRTKTELRAITTIGIMNGALEAQKSMEKQLTDSVSDLILNSNMLDIARIMPKIEKIEKIVERDRQAIRVLGSALDLARRSITKEQYRKEMKRAMKEVIKKKRQINEKDYDVQKRVQRLKENVLDHVGVMQKTLFNKTHETISYLESVQGFSGSKKRKREDHDATSTTESILADIMRDNQEDNAISKRQDNTETFSLEAELQSKEDDKKSSNQTEGSSGEKSAEQPGGLVGIIGSLSGGEGGSDVGALIGSLTGVIAQLFGPNGLDVESLISTATSLISGLLAGNKNFGTVLGQYVGTAFDGLSGGGGAINNGKFVGNFLGTVLASLSADPEDDDKPPQPFVFLQNFIHTLVAAKNSPGAMSGETADIDRSGEAWNSAPPQKGPDSFGFLKQIVSSLVGGLTSIVLNASLGSVGGLSSGSSSLFAGSSGPKQPH